MSDLAALRDEATTALSGAADLRSLETLRVRFLGKKGAIKAL